jgi:hypothetical protein
MRVLVASPGNGRTRDSYVCHHGYHVRRARLDVDVDVDQLITALVVGRLAMPDAAPALTRGDGAQVQEARAKAAALRARLVSPDLLDLATPDITKRWPTLPLAHQRADIDLLLDIKVDRTSRGGGDASFDPKGIRSTWKTT